MSSLLIRNARLVNEGRLAGVFLRIAPDCCVPAARSFQY